MKIYMRYKMVKVSVLIVCALSLGGLQAQEALLSSGGNASGKGGSVSYSVGQIVYTTISDNSESIAQGVQQPFEISIITETEQTQSISLICSAYPNPTTDYLTLHIDGSTTDNMQLMTYQIYDIVGKLLEDKKVTENETTISMSGYVPSIYFLKVTDGTDVKLFKIIKN